VKAFKDGTSIPDLADPGYGHAVDNLDGEGGASAHGYLELSVGPDGAVGHEVLRVGKTHLRTELRFPDYDIGDTSHTNTCLTLPGKEH
jgi:hypothetical protein